MLISDDLLKNGSLISNRYCLPYNPRLKERSRNLRNNMTNCEKIFWKFIRSFGRYNNLTFNRQKIIDNYIVDFYCAKLKLVIEIDGEIHNLKDNIAYDKIRDDVLNKYGLKVIRIRNIDILNNFNNVCKFIKTEIIKLTKN